MSPPNCYSNSGYQWDSISHFQIRLTYKNEQTFKVLRIIFPNFSLFVLFPFFTQLDIHVLRRKVWSCNLEERIHRFQLHLGELGIRYCDNTVQNSFVQDEDKHFLCGSARSTTAQRAVRLDGGVELLLPSAASLTGHPWLLWTCAQCRDTWYSEILLFEILLLSFYRYFGGQDSILCFFTVIKTLSM